MVVKKKETKKKPAKAAAPKKEVKAKPAKKSSKYAEKGQTEQELEDSMAKVEQELDSLESLQEEGDDESDADEETHHDSEEHVHTEHQVMASKPMKQVKKGDIVIVDGISYAVDSHYVLIDHGSTKEMAVELFNPKTDKDYQLRYFDDQVENTLEFYELQEIMYIKKPFIKISW